MAVTSNETRFEFNDRGQLVALSRSERGRAFVISVEGGEIKCECKGFEYRGRCAHTEAAKNRADVQRLLQKQVASAKSAPVNILDMFGY